MPRRRLALLATAFLLGGALPAAPAGAVDTARTADTADTGHTVVVHDVYGEWGGRYRNVPCGDFVTFPGTLLGRVDVTWTTDPAAPLGRRALLFDPQGDTAAGVFGYTATPSTASTSLRVGPGADQAAEVARYLSPTTDESWVGVSRLDDFGDVSEWVTLESGADLTWYPSDRNGFATGPALPGTQDVAAFAAAHGGDAVGGHGGAELGWALGCGGDAFLVDALRVGPIDATTTWDFEGVLADLDAPRAPRTITAGHTIAVGGYVTDADYPVGPTGLVLQSRPVGASDWRRVGVGTSDDSDYENPIEASVPGRPLVRTTYRWRYLGDDTFEEGYSPTLTIDVRTALTLTAPSRATRGKPFTLAGQTTPAKPRAALTVQRKQGSRWVKVATGRTDGQGRYALPVRSGQAGRNVLRVVGAGGSGNLPGTSPARWVRVT